jgi:hypothetical protein
MEVDDNCEHHGEDLPGGEKDANESSVVKTLPESNLHKNSSKNDSDEKKDGSDQIQNGKESSTLHSGDAVGTDGTPLKAAVSSSGNTNTYNPAANNDKLDSAVEEVTDDHTGQVEESDSQSVTSSIKAAREKIVQELAQKGVAPALGRNHGQFIVLDDPDAEEKQSSKAKGIKALMDRLMKQHQKRTPKQPDRVKIRFGFLLINL